MVAWEAAVPGTPSMTEEMVSPVVTTAYMPINRANASTGSRENVNGSSSARAISPPRPGTAPKNSPINTPIRR